MKKEYYEKLDLIRILACIGVFLYHLSILKGGYLFVCTFFVLSGYLSCISALKKKNFSIISFYKNRLIHIYIPLIIILFITTAIMSFIPNLNYVSLKPEGLSILFGYNNFWQISANSDYFARHINSPFMHLWYISILIQFEIIFPFLFLFLRKLGEKANKIIPCIITIAIGIISCLYFYHVSFSQNITSVYYNTLSRIFSILFGLSLGFVSFNYKMKRINKKKRRRINYLFYFLLAALITLSMFDSSKTKYYNLFMIGITVISTILIFYGTRVSNKKENKLIKYISSITYEIYLIQYPVIYFLQNININYYIKLSFIVLITIIISIILHFCLNIKNKKNKRLRYFTLIIVILLTLFGGYKFIITKDNTKEMRELELLLEKNEEEMKKRQEEYEAKIKSEKENLESELKSLEENESTLNDYIKNLPIVGIGDSVMLGAVWNLYEMFPNGYFDAKVSRTDYEANAILVNLQYNNLLGDPIIFNLGTNGQCGEVCRLNILNSCGNRTIFWVTVTNDFDVRVNDDLKSFAERHDNVYIIDWEEISKGHYDYFVADGIHLTETGREAYVSALYDSIYQVYMDKYNKEKEKVINNYEENQKRKISFYSNDLLLNAYSELQNIYSDANYFIDKNFDYDSLYEKINEDIKLSNINYNVVIALDNSIKLTNKQYQDIIKLLKDKNLYIIKMINNDFNFEYQNVHVIDFYKEISNNTDYVLSDGIHLSNLGNEKLIELLKEEIIIERH